MSSQWNPYPLGRRDVPPDTVTKKVSATSRAAAIAAGVRLFPATHCEEESRLMRTGLGNACFSFKV